MWTYQRARRRVLSGVSLGDDRVNDDTAGTVTSDCSCEQHGDYCRAHPNCACGCPRHAHSKDPGVGCFAGSMTCHGCTEYRPAKLRRFHELCDDQIDEMSLDDLRVAYREFRAHHIEETTAMWGRTMVAKFAELATRAELEGLGSSAPVSIGDASTPK